MTHVTIPPTTVADLDPGRRAREAFPAGVTAVVFDVVGTLVEPVPSVAEAYAAAGRRHGLDLGAAEIDPRFRSAWRRQEEIDAVATPPFTTSRGRERARWQAIVEDVFGPTAVTAAVFADLWEHFGRPEAWKPITAGAALVRTAVDAGLVVALASNFDERLLAIAPVVEPLTLADHVFASSEIGWRKPAVEFFRQVETRLGRRPHELVLVGDDPDLDVAAAGQAGWRAIRIG